MIRTGDRPQAGLDPVPTPVAPRLQGRPQVDQNAMLAYRVERVRQGLRDSDAELAILTSPVSLRYVANFRDYALFQAHIPIAYAFVPLDGPVIVHGANPQSPGVVGELRPARGISAFNAGPNLAEEASRLARDVVDALPGSSVRGRRIALEYANPSLVQALMRTGFDVVDAVGLLDRARSIKCSQELDCIRWSIAVAQAGIARMRTAMRPGITENQLWAVLGETNIANDGDWCDGRMLCSGPRTNPWLQEASDRSIGSGELVAFDTDMVGPFGYCADISRTWLCGDGRPSGHQRSLYRRAFEEVHANMELIRPGATFREISEGGFVQPERFIPNRYVCLAHGVGMCDEWPKIYYRQDWSRSGYDGMIEANMVLCVESYVGAVNAPEGVKLEQQILVTSDGIEPLSSYPFDDALLGSEI